jgi:2-polyprenyl-3-methyl-5-hydroxy-6-metoxy-1,4-benzoquinol methylase
MKRKVYHPREKATFTGKPEIDIWNAQSSGKSLNERVREAKEDEVYSILTRFDMFKGQVLDAGCSYGRWVKILHDKGASVCGMDFARVGIHNLAGSLPNVPLMIGDVRSLPYRNDMFDMVLSLGVMEHAEAGPMKALTQAFGALKPGGALVVSVPLISLNRLLNPIIMIRRFSSSLNPIRHVLGKGKKEFFQYEFSVSAFMHYLTQTGFRVRFWSPIWMDFGVRDDFGCLYALILLAIRPFARYPSFGKFVRYFFGAFVVFVAVKPHNATKTPKHEKESR